ncbi:MAG: hypothetical protein IJ525_02315 [Alphaproteobacteria bacterium]|nr:hypothetical protein [Alphaproteobacteria bacterium]
MKSITNENWRSLLPEGDADVPQSGRSMIEMLGVLAIIGVLSVGGIAGYSKAMQKYRINKTIEQITLISGNIRAFWGPQNNYLGVRCSAWECNSSSGCTGHGINSSGNYVETYNGCPIIKKAKIFPEEMLTLSDDGKKIMGITNPFGYPTSLSVFPKSVEGDNKAFGISYYTGDNVEACIELMTQDWSNANVNAIGLLNEKSDIYFKTPISIDLAAAKCSEIIASTTDADKVKGRPYISFYFDIDLNGSYWNAKAKKTYSWQN